jgi:excisionase family DNA binding protein
VASEPISRPRLLTASEATAIVRVSPESVRRWVGEGRLAAVRLGDSPQARIRIETHELARFLRAGPDKEAA